MPDPRREEGEESLMPDQKPPDARIRFEHAGEWIAWDLDMTRAVAFGEDDEALSLL